MTSKLLKTYRIIDLLCVLCSLIIGHALHDTDFLFYLTCVRPHSKSLPFRTPYLESLADVDFSVLFENVCGTSAGTCPPLVDLG